MGLQPPWSVSYPILHRYATLRRAMRPPRGPGIIGDVDLATLPACPASR